MFVQGDFKHLKLKSNNKLLFFPTKIIKPKKLLQKFNKYERGYFQYFRVILDEFICYFSVHGMDRIFQRNLNIFKRFTWLVGFSICFWVLVHVSLQVAYEYSSEPLITVVSDTQYPVFRIPFPEVTICNRNRFNWQRFDMAKRIYLRPEHQLNPKYVTIFMEVLNAYDTLAFAKFNKFENLTTVALNLLADLNYINFHLVAEFMAWKCHEIFSACEWIGEVHNCCEIFFQRNSPLGSCLAFNSIESIDGLNKQKLDPFWPWRAKDGGIDNGLRVRIHIREQDHSPKRKNKQGILVMLAEPHVWYSNPIEVYTHSRTSISIKPSINKYSDYTRVLSPKVRQCFFKDELINGNYLSLPNRVYMYENCKSQCQQEYLIKLCNCTFSLFYPIGDYKPCQLVDYPCLYYNNENFKHLGARNKTIRSNTECTCIYNCKSLIYGRTITTAYMTNQKIDFNNSYIDLSVFFQKRFLIEILTTVLYTLTDLMASFGGLAGLCIGCSLLSLVEIAYFFIIDIPKKLLLYNRKQQQLKLRKKSRKAKVAIVENYSRKQITCP